MNPDILKFLSTSQHLVRVPRYIEKHIQKCALVHLGLKDMGKLRDRMEGQFYYTRLRKRIISTFAFEKAILGKNYNWASRESTKEFNETYKIDNLSVRIVSYDSGGAILPLLKDVVEDIVIFSYVHPDSKVYFSLPIEKSIFNRNRDKIDSRSISSLVEAIQCCEQESCRFSSIEEFSSKVKNL